MYSRIKITLRIAVLIAVCEIIIMFALPFLPFATPDSLQEFLLDATILAFTTAPLIALVVLFPLHKRYKTPVNWLTITVKLPLIIFFIELLIMSILFWTKPYLTQLQITVIDGIIVALLSAPLIYLVAIQSFIHKQVNRHSMGMLPFVVITSMVVIIIGLVFIGITGMETISGMRSFVAAEGLWSQSQKSAVIHLIRYAEKKEEQDYNSFKNYIEVTLWNKKARLELEKERPNLETALDALIQGGSHPDDVNSMALLFIWNKDLEYIKRIIQIWEKGDEQIADLEALGKKVHQYVLQNRTSPKELDKIIKEVMFVNEVLTALEDEFSHSIGEATRWAKGLLFILMYLSAIIAATICIWLLLFVSKIFYSLQISNSNLSQKSSELENLTKTLEQRVADRTKNLNDSLENIRQIQSQLIESEKMASLGGLVAGVTHEIKTPIGIGVTGSSYLQTRSREFMDKFNSGKLSRTDLEQYIQDTSESSSLILSNLSRASELVKSFKQVAVDQSTQDFLFFNVNNHLSNTLMSIRPVLKNSPYTINYDCSKELEILGLPGAWSQVIINLVMNSLLHGFNGRDHGSINIKVEQIDKQIFMQYQDDGLGMDKKTKERLFEPFFTTRRGEGGTGLGMHIVYNLVTKTLYGKITCESSPNNGTTFNITLPIIAKEKQATDISL
ncbi:MAG: HAMP domain-containing histidine kinase [Magnetococcales bacterium]|nr:HAMP domain-containing histidine kinase [Magnetococcales bacterium]